MTYWDTSEHAYGVASDIPPKLARLRDGEDVVEDLEAALVHQGHVYPPAYYAIDPLALMLDDGHPQLAKIIALLTAIAVGPTYDLPQAFKAPKPPASMPKKAPAGGRLTAACYHAVSRHAPRVRELLAHPSEGIRTAAAFFLAWFPSAEGAALAVSLLVKLPASNAAAFEGLIAATLAGNEDAAKRLVERAFGDEAGAALDTKQRRALEAVLDGNVFTGEVVRTLEKRGLPGSVSALSARVGRKLARRRTPLDDTLLFRGREARLTEHLQDAVKTKDGTRPWIELVDVVLASFSPAAAVHAAIDVDELGGREREGQRTGQPRSGARSGARVARGAACPRGAAGSGGADGGARSGQERQSLRWADDLQRRSVRAGDWTGARGALAWSDRLRCGREGPPGVRLLSPSEPGARGPRSGHPRRVAPPSRARRRRSAERGIPRRLALLGALAVATHDGAGPCPGREVGAERSLGDEAQRLCGSDAAEVRGGAPRARERGGCEALRGAHPALSSSGRCE
jgi:hypothetical protein